MSPPATWTARPVPGSCACSWNFAWRAIPSSWSRTTRGWPPTRGGSSTCRTVRSWVRGEPMSPLNVMRTALRGIIANPLRTALTTLGIIIGVASVIATLALGNGARAAVEANFRFLGSDQIQIDTDLQLKNGQMQVVGKTLTYEDGLGLPDAAPLVDRAEMTVRESAKLRHGRETKDLA